MNLQHHFLIAMPSLQDPFFKRSVVYICEHNEEGAMGLIINKPMENLTVEGILKKLKITSGERDPAIRLDKPVFSGGPLAEDRGFILHSAQRIFSSSIRISDTTVITTSRDVLGLMMAGVPATAAEASTSAHTGTTTAAVAEPAGHEGEPHV